ncbi:MAG TPA: hypothetical protein VEC39_05315 [Vicinamibacterales bacterium]|nr:hypothetical protein [Vicinamibacterales bacterium]
MARPNNATAISAHVEGLREAKQRFQALPPFMQQKRIDVNSATAAAVALGAKQRLVASPAIRTRRLHDHVKWKITKTSGVAIVGVSSGSTIVNVRPGVRKNVRIKGIAIAGRGGSALTSQGARFDRPSRRAHLIEFGWSKAPAEPFMIPATDAQKEPHLQRWRAAGRQLERDIAGLANLPSTGGGLL